MASVRLQSRYWRLIHHCIELTMIDLEKKEKRLKAKSARRDHYLVHERLKFEKKLEEVRKDIMRLDAIDNIILAAARKPDGLFTAPVGPDAPEPVTSDETELTPEEEERLRWLEQID